MTTEESSTGETSTGETSKHRLRGGSVGLLGAAMLGAVIMGPSLVIFANWGPMIPELAPGRATALVFLIALLMTLPTAYSYSLLARDVPSAGAAYKWGSRFVKPSFGIAVGFCAVIFYIALMSILPPLIGLLVSDLFSTTSTAVFALAAFGSIALVVPLVYRGINLNIDTAIVVVAIEVFVLTTIGLFAWITLPGSTFSWAPLDPSGIPSGAALSTALIFGVLSFTGYDAVATISEETRQPRRTIPKATMLAVVLVGSYWIVMSFIFSNAATPAAYVTAIDAGHVPLTFVANDALGSWARILIDLLGIQASFGVLIGSTIAASRMLFALGRDGVLPKRLGTVHHKFKVPWSGITVVLASGVLINLLVGIYVGFSFTIYLWSANIVVFFALLTYMSVNLSNFAYFWRHNDAQLNVFKNVLVPFAGIAVSGYFMYKAFFSALWGAGFEMGRSIVITGILLLAAAIVAGVVLSRRAGHRAAGEDDFEQEGLDDPGPLRKTI